LLLFESGAKNNPQDLLVHRIESQLTVVDQVTGLNPVLPAARLRGPATVVSLQMNAQPLSQGDRLPNGKPRTLPARPAVPSRAAGRLWCEVSSNDLPNRRHDHRTDKRVVLPRA
jgi:hypothetical protein